MSIENFIVSLDDFRAFLRVRDSGRFNMMTEAVNASVAAGISYDKYMHIIFNFTRLELMFSNQLNKENKPMHKVKKTKRVKQIYEPDQIPNCGYVEDSFVVQSYIPTIEKCKNWKVRSVDLHTLDDALKFIDDEKSIRKLSNGPKHKYRIIKKKVIAEVVQVED